MLPAGATPIPSHAAHENGHARFRQAQPSIFQLRFHVGGVILAVSVTLLLAAWASATVETALGLSSWPVISAMIAAIYAIPLFGAARAASGIGKSGRLGDRFRARVQADLARHNLLQLMGFSGFLSCVFAISIFFTAGDGAVQKTFLDWEFIQSSFVDIACALWINIGIAVATQILSMACGLILAIARLLPGRSLFPIRALAIAYIDVFRGLPAIVVIYLICFGLPITRIPILSEGPPVVYAIFALTITFSAYNAELFRSGIEGVNESQTAAALSLGMTPAAVMRIVILPQAMRHIMAPVLSLFIALQKDTALVNVVGIIDSFTQAKILSSQNFNLSSITVVCFLFIILTIPQTRFVDAMLARSDRKRSKSAEVA